MQTTKKEPAAAEETKTEEDVGAKKQSGESKGMKDEAAVSHLVSQGVRPRAGSTLNREDGIFVGEWRAPSLFSWYEHGLYSWYGYGLYSWYRNGIHGIERGYIEKQGVRSTSSRMCVFPSVLYVFVYQFICQFISACID